MARPLTFDALVREEISGHVALDDAGYAPQVSLSGPTGVELRSSTVQTFALAMHELATNVPDQRVVQEGDNG